MIDTDLLDEHFPHRPSGYFDHAAVGTAPQEVEEAVARIARALSKGTRGGSEWRPLAEETASMLGSEFGGDAERTIVLANTSTAFIAASRAIPFSGHDEILVFDDDFPTPRVSWRGITSARVRSVKVAAGQDRTSAMLEAVDRRTRVISTTHVHASTGEVTDLQRLSEAIHAQDGLLVTDGAQAAGLLSGGALFADVYVGASYKWLLGGFGSAVVCTSARFDEQARPQLIGYANTPPSSRLDVGHSNPFALASLSAASRVRQRIGLEEIRVHTLDLASRISSAATALGFALAVDRPESGIVSLRVPDAARKVAQLADHGLTASVRDGAVRLSPYVTTTEADMENLLHALALIAGSTTVSRD